MIRLAIAEDHQSLIDGIKLLLDYEDGISIVGTANDGEALLEIVEKKQPNVVLTDIRMPKLDGIQAAKHIKKNHPSIKILAFTMFDQTEAIQQMLDAGASGYILKNSSLTEVHKAIITVFNGDTYFDADINTNILNSEVSNKSKGILTKRQIEILELIAQGKTSREIADILFIGIHTVDTHRKNMVRILGLQGKGELMRYALEKKYRFKSE
ncbi:response regulator transcription factor [Algibacter sp. 2305UL17-15]|uniref:response regulator transcription factor n=1 Tax=Algibacter sp. 2305UL17-15 TaxID=3231268 RepID=UPI003457F05E